MSKEKKLEEAINKDYHCEFYSVFPNDIGETCYLCNRPLHDKYFRFSCKNNDDKREIFYTGIECGKKIFEITGQVPPKFFNIEDKIQKLTNNKDTQNISKIDRDISSTASKEINKPAENIECILAISLLFYVGVKDKTNYLNSVKQQFEDNPNRKLTFKIANALNNFAINFCRDHKCPSIRNYIKIIAPNKKIDKYQLPIFEKVLAEQKIASYF